eukprot:1144154-Pelagomonas_calceolata.AAC.3
MSSSSMVLLPWGALPSTCAPRGSKGRRAAASLSVWTFVSMSSSLRPQAAALREDHGSSSQTFQPPIVHQCCSVWQTPHFIGLQPYISSHFENAACRILTPLCEIPACKVHIKVT